MTEGVAAPGYAFGTLGEDEVFRCAEARIIQCIPFWLRVCHRPFSADERPKKFEAIARNLSAMKTAPLENWRAAALKWPPDPARFELRRRVQLRADIKDPQPLLTIQEWLKGAGYADRVAVHVAEAQLFYEDHGLGAVEHVVSLTAGGDPAGLHSLLRDAAVWRRYGDAYLAMVDGRKLALHAAWPNVRRCFEAAIDKADRLPRFGTLRGPTVADRDDDFCWSYGSSLLLVRQAARPSGTAWDREADVVRAIATTYVQENAFRPDASSGERLDLSAYGIDHLFFGPISIVAAIGAGQSEAAISRVRVLTRHLLIAYGSLTEAADGLQARIAQSVTQRAGSRSERDLLNEQETLTRLGGVVARLRYDASPDNFTADSVEDGIYRTAFQHWMLKDNVELINQSIEDADRLLERVSAIGSQRSDATLNTILVIISGLTLASVIKDVTDFLAETNPLTVTRDVLHLALMIGVFALTLGVVVFRIGVPRPHRRR